MSYIIRYLDFKSFSAFVRFYSLTRQSHYEVLQLRRNCSDKDIKEAFFKLSKQYHPDKNKDSKAQEKFVRIVEAYNVLSKPSSRAQYDHLTEVATNTASYVYRTHVPYNLRKKPQYSYYYDIGPKPQDAKQRSQNQNSYYGFAGIKRLPNSAIVIICIAFAFVGLIVQLIVIRQSFNLHRRQAYEKSKRNAEELQRIRDIAIENGNEVQARLLLEKIVTAANPTVATASLGQALANEKKIKSGASIGEFETRGIVFTIYDDNNQEQSPRS